MPITHVDMAWPRHTKVRVHGMAVRGWWGNCFVFRERKGLHIAGNCCVYIIFVFFVCCFSPLFSLECCSLYWAARKAFKLKLFTKPNVDHGRLYYPYEALVASKPRTTGARVSTSYVTLTAERRTVDRELLCEHFTFFVCCCSHSSR